MSQLNFNVSGDHGDDKPVLTLDSGDVHLGTFESAGRFIVTLPATVSGGATVHYQYGQKSFRVIVPPGPGSWEAGAPPCIPPEYHGDGLKVVLAYSASVGDVQIVDDHFELNGKRWLVRGVDGFCDLAVLLDSGEGALRPQLLQSRDLGVRVRRIFGAMKNIRDFNPDRYGAAYFDGLRALYVLYAEFGLYGDFDVLPDCQLLGWSLGRCQQHWAQVCDVLGPLTNSFNVSLTNEFDHGGNLVGSPTDYPRPAIAKCSQGSAVSDAPPPRPGWGMREFHCLKDWPKIFLCEDMLFNREGVNADGSTWGPRKPIYLSECARFEEGKPETDERLARTLALESAAFGEGLIIHNEFGKDGRMMGPRVASCVKTAMDVLIAVEG